MRLPVLLTISCPSASMSTSLLPQKSMAEMKEDRELSLALDTHRAAMFVLTQKDRPIPSIQEMQEDLSKDELASVKEQIATAKATHKVNLGRLYAAHAADYLDDQRLRRESREEYAASPAETGGNKLVEWSAKRDPLSSTDHHYLQFLSQSITVECSRFMTVIHSLSVQKAEIEQAAEEERRKRDAAFPLTLKEFRAKPRDIQIRVASFLNSDAQKKDRMMTEFGWAWRQVEGLMREFASDDDFKAEVSKLIETLDSRDPRRKYHQPIMLPQLSWN